MRLPVVGTVIGSCAASTAPAQMDQITHATAASITANESRQEAPKVRSVARSLWRVLRPTTSTIAAASTTLSSPGTENLRATNQAETVIRNASTAANNTASIRLRAPRD